MELHHYWIIVGIIFLIAEIGTPGGFLLASLGLSAFGGSLMAYLDFTFKIQLFAYSALSIIIFFTIRPLYLKYLQGAEADVGIGTNAYLGQEYKVTETINNIENTGRLQIGSENWRARTEINQEIKKGETVKVLRLEGSSVIVSKLENKGE